MSLELEFKKHLSNESHKHGIIDHRKHKKSSSKQNFTNKEYHVQHNKYVKHQDVKIYCAINQFPELKLLGPHRKPHSVRGLGNHYHMYFYPKLGHGTCAILHIPCDYTSCNSILDQTWVPDFPAYQKPRYQPVQYFTY